MHLYDLRCGVELDDWELGLRVACAMYAENQGGWASRYDMIAFRGYDAQGQKRLRKLESRRNDTSNGNIPGLASLSRSLVL